MRYRVGPLLVWTIPNTLGHCRLGLAVGRRAGNAVVRNRIKRSLRQGFRLQRARWPAAYDVVVGADRHPRLPADEYGELLTRAVERLHHKWLKRQAQASSDD